MHHLPFKRRPSDPRSLRIEEQRRNVADVIGEGLTPRFRLRSSDRR